MTTSKIAGTFFLEKPKDDDSKGYAFRIDVKPDGLVTVSGHAYQDEIKAIVDRQLAEGAKFAAALVPALRPLLGLAFQGAQEIRKVDRAMRAAAAAKEDDRLGILDTGGRGGESDLDPERFPFPLPTRGPIRFAPNGAVVLLQDRGPYDPPELLRPGVKINFGTAEVFLDAVLAESLYVQLGRVLPSLRAMHRATPPAPPGSPGPYSS